MGKNLGVRVERISFGGPFASGLRRAAAARSAWLFRSQVQSLLSNPRNLRLLALRVSVWNAAAPSSRCHVFCTLEMRAPVVRSPVETYVGSMDEERGKHRIGGQARWRSLRPRSQRARVLAEQTGSQGTASRHFFRPHRIGHLSWRHCAR